MQEQAVEHGERASDRHGDSSPEARQQEQPAGPVVTFDQLSAVVPVTPNTTFAQVRAEGIQALEVHAPDPTAYRIVVNGEVVRDENGRLVDYANDPETLQIRLIKLPTLGPSEDATAHGSGSQ